MMAPYFSIATFNKALGIWEGRGWGWGGVGCRTLATPPPPQPPHLQRHFIVRTMLLEQRLNRQTGQTDKFILSLGHNMT